MTSNLGTFSNILNTNANNGCGPFSQRRCKAELILSMLFSKEVVLPGTSFLCNPSVHGLINDEPDFIDFILKEPTYRILLHKTNFQGQLNSLLAKDSAAVAHLPHKTLEEKARYFDDAIGSLRNISNKFFRVDRSYANDIKTKHSLAILKKLDKINPGLTLFEDRIVDLGKEQLDMTGSIDGTWWINLGKQYKWLKSFDRDFSSLGTFIFDSCYASLTSRQLSGHPYCFAPSDFVKFAEGIVLQKPVELEVRSSDDRELNGLCLDHNSLANISTSKLMSLLSDTEPSKLAFFRAIDELTRFPSNDNYYEAKSRLDEYVIELSNFIVSSDLRYFKQESESVRKMESSIKIWRTSKMIIYGIGIGSSALVAQKAITFPSTMPMGLAILFFCSAISLPVKSFFDHALKSRQDKLVEKSNELQKGSPVSIKLNLAD